YGLDDHTAGALDKNAELAGGPPGRDRRPIIYRLVNLTIVDGLPSIVNHEAGDRAEILKVHHLIGQRLDPYRVDRWHGYRHGKWTALGHRLTPNAERS